MNPETLKLQAQIDELRRRLDNFNDSSLMDIEFERAFKERFNIVGFRGFTFGVITMAAGSATIRDANITTTSRGYVQNTASRATTGVSSQSMLGVTTAIGYALITESTGNCTDQVNYLIFY